MEGSDKPSQIKREIAYKVRIGDILEGRYVKEDGWKPNYVLREDGKRLSRVNVIGVVVSKNINGMNSLFLEDSSARISVRAFDDSRGLDSLEIGEVVLLIARPREYGNERYLAAEILKKIKDKRWIDVRKIELGGETVKKARAAEEDAKVEEETVEVDERSLPQKIFSLIRELDGGDGVDIEAILKRIGSKDAERIISNFLKEGEIFEIRPGRIKILE